jgi:hypothetical protein
VIAGLRCNYPKDGPGFFAGSRSDGFCRLRRNQAPLSLYAIVLKTRILQAYLGHRNIQHTVRYTELSPTRFKNLWRD